MFYLDGVILIHLGGVLPGLIELGWWQLYRFTWDFGNAWHLVMASKRLDWSTMDVELLWRWEWWCLSVLLIAMLCFLLGGVHVCRTSIFLVAVEHRNQVGVNVQSLMSTLLPLFFIFKLPNPILKSGVSWVGSQHAWTQVVFFMCEASCKFICVHSKNPYTHVDPGTSTWEVSKSLPPMAKCLEISNCPTSSKIYVEQSRSIFISWMPNRKVSFILSSPSSATNP